MATNFPTSLDNLTNPAGSDPVNNPSHASQHANLNDAIEKLEEKVGVNNSAVTTSLDYRVKQLETNPVASYTDEEARNAIGTALTGSGGITVTPNNVANTITVSTDNTIATKTYVDTAVSNIGSTAASTYVPVSEVGQADGIATLDATGKVPLTQLGNLIDGAPTALYTLNELAAALGNDSSYAATITTALGNKAPIASPTFTGTVSGITKSMVDLGSVDNTADTAKPVSTAQATAIATAKSEVITEILGAGVPAALNTLDELAAALGDDANYAATVTTSLGLKAPLASPTFTGTVTVAAAGVAFTDGTQTKEGVPSRTPIIAKTDSYTLSALTERDSLIEVAKATATTITIPTDATLNFPIGTSVDILQTSTGQVTIAGASGVTVNATPGLKLRTTWSSATLFKRAANTWVVYGDLTA